MVDVGNTVVLIEHHMDLMKNADWIIDLGPGAGEKGGYLIASGTPEQVAEMEHSYTGQYLSQVLEADDRVEKGNGRNGTKTRRKARVKVKAGG